MYRQETPWHAFLHHHHKPWQDLTLARPPQSPLLLVPSEDGHRHIRKLHNVFDGKTHTLPLTVRYNRRCCGSSHGWLAIFRRTMRVTLVNPTSPTERRIVLPPIMKRPKCAITTDRPFTFYCWVAKVVLSDDPDLVSPRDCVVAVIENSYLTLAFMRLSDRQWTFADTQYSLLCDVVFCDGFLYAADLYGMLIRIDLAGDNKVEVVVPRFFDEQTYKVYTVKSIGGGILLVRRSVGHDEDAPLFTTGFRVYRLVEELGGGWKWIEVKKLNDDEVLFVGDNESMSFSCGDQFGCNYKTNCIYYTDDSFDDGHYREQGPNDLGVYNLEDGCFERTYILKSWEKNFPPPIFFVPKLFDNGSRKNI